MQDHLSGYPVVIEQHLAWGDMDAHGHVNNVWFFRYLENVRVAYFEAIDKYDYEKRSGNSFILAHTGCRYLAPLVYPDCLRVGARIASIEEDRATMDYRIVSTARDRVAAQAEATLVSFDYSSGTKVPFPQVLRERIQELEGRAF